LYFLDLAILQRSFFELGAILHTWQKLLQAATGTKQALKHSEMLNILCKLHSRTHNPRLVRVVEKLSKSIIS